MSIEKHSGPLQFVWYRMGPAAAAGTSSTMLEAGASGPSSAPSSSSSAVATAVGSSLSPPDVTTAAMPTAASRVTARSPPISNFLGGPDATWSSGGGAGGGFWSQPNECPSS